MVNSYHKKGALTLKKRRHSYQRQLAEYRRIELVCIARTELYIVAAAMLEHQHSQVAACSPVADNYIRNVTE